MATANKERHQGAVKGEECAQAATTTQHFYQVGPDDLDTKLSDLIEMRVFTHGSRFVAGQDEALGKSRFIAGYSKARVRDLASKVLLLDVESLARKAAPYQSSFLFRVKLPRGNAQHADLVIEPARSPDMAQELLDASFDLVKQPDAEVEAMRRALTQRTVDSVLQGTRWLTSAELNSVRKDKTSNPSMTIGRWLQSGSMFALESRGSRVIPEYALDQLGEPIALLKPVLSLMKGRTGFLIAAWFESPNSYLDGKRPRELLATRGLDVVRAAEIHVAEDFHG